MNALKKIFFLFLVFFLFFLLIELFSRSLVFIITKNKVIYSYGFNKTIIFRINDLSQFDFLLYATKSKKLKKTKKNYNKSERIVIWTFGGSSTKGDASKCSHYTSSWPDELSNLNKSIIVKNFGKKGNSTNYAINILYDQNLKEKPDIILWAGKYNDQFNFGQIDKSKLILMKRIDYTLKLNSVFYFLLNDLIERITFKIIGYQEPNIIGEQIESLKYAKSIKKYEQNTLNAINFAKNYDIDFHIISLFGFESPGKILHIEFYDYWFNSAEKLSEEYGVFYFKTEEEASKVLKNYKNEKLFCDRVPNHLIHQTLKGNILTASIINDYLMKIYNFENN